MLIPSHIPVTVARFAVLHHLPLALRNDGRDYWYECDGDMTRTLNPRVCHALALCRRVIRARTAGGSL